MAKDNQGSVATVTSDIQAKPKDAEKPKTAPYYCGLTPDCPYDYITVPTLPREGAVTLHKFSQKLVDNGNGVASPSAQMPGGILDLFQDEYEKVLEYGRSNYVLWENRGENKRVSIIPREGAGSRRSRREDYAGNVEPLSRYMYIVLARAVTMGDQVASHLPKTVLEMEPGAA